MTSGNAAQCTELACVAGCVYVAHRARARASHLIMLAISSMFRPVPTFHWPEWLPDGGRRLYAWSIVWSLAACGSRMMSNAFRDNMPAGIRHKHTLLYSHTGHRPPAVRCSWDTATVADGDTQSSIVFLSILGTAVGVLRRLYSHCIYSIQNIHIFHVMYEEIEQHVIIIIASKTKCNTRFGCCYFVVVVGIVFFLYFSSSAACP